MTYAQKMLDERRLGYAEGRAEGRAEGEAKGRAEGEARGRAEGRAEGIKEAIMALGSVLEPAVIAERFKVPLEQVLEFLGQK